MSHLIFPTSNLSLGVHYFHQLGYRTSFIKKNIENVEIKKILMRRFSTKQSFGLLSMNNNYPIELVDHGHLNEEASGFTPIFENISPSLVETQNSLHLFDSRFSRGILKLHRAPVLVQNTGSAHNRFKFNKLMVTTPDPKQTFDFFSMLGFVLSEQNRNYIISRFRSPLDSTDYYIMIIKGGASHFLLDNIGFNCVSFITNSVETEKERMETIYKVTKIEKLPSKQVKIFFAIGPFGELAEIIEPGWSRG